MNMLDKQGQTLPYVIQRKPIKNTYFRIKSDHVLVTTNRFMPEKQIIAYLRQRFDALYHKLNQQPGHEPDDVITLWGERHGLSFVDQPVFRYVIADRQVIVHGRREDSDALKKAIYAKELEKRLNMLDADIRQTLDRHDIPTRAVKIKYLKSKFGSYHKRKQEITLNSYLARLKPVYLLYVVYHEYAHAVIFNHSPAFYTLLGRLMPDYKVWQKDLKLVAIP
ncbi:MAG: DUF45 domain-containing protein [Acholeplasmataceae bacterium]|nr:MAG: DUF45 domain-containing protein [Acholeplasmataceae bacterium]